MALTLSFLRAKGSCAQNLQLAPSNFLGSGVWFSNVAVKPSEFTTTLTSTYSPGQWVLYYLNLSAMPKLYYTTSGNYFNSVCGNHVLHVATVSETTEEAWENARRAVWSHF